jgi:RNA polymerase sigma-70 factor (ECF subfamily)
VKGPLLENAGAFGLRGAGEWTIRVSGQDVVQPGPDAGAEVDERTLVAAAVRGDRRASDLIVERHQRAVYLLCYRFTGRHEDAADLAQEAFLRAFRALGSFKGESSLNTWLYRIAMNVCLNRAAARTPAVEAIEPHRELRDPRADPAADADRAERAARVRAAIRRLPRKQRATLVLRLYHDLSHREIAALLGASVGAVKANFFHALRNLKKILGDSL